ncbi:hypothetical protein LGH83_08930 [Lichenihabitans sp. PAMC28606]|uniref:hypothetical protein n=1 Tax=Lichenihabitans sp. PAMC28606 TaxID=2880932 RepID=UPI001D0B3FB9|nr:hypothetical protein [Lichenihabitans sp. PAMC28606]UDL96280.1 hypothetical protein LGH83_08930 [Lichenihabitans sp. PAMC28606]
MKITTSFDDYMEYSYPMESAEVFAELIDVIKNRETSEHFDLVPHRKGRLLSHKLSSLALYLASEKAFAAFTAFLDEYEFDDPDDDDPDEEFRRKLDDPDS